jgi:hypothetical protein
VCLDKDEILKEVKERVFNSKEFLSVTAFFVPSQDLRQCNTELRVRKRDSKLIRFVSVSQGTLTLREAHRLRVFENRVLRRTFGPKRDEITGGWRKLHNDKLHNLYSSSNIIRQIKSRRMKWAGNVARMGQERKV